MIPDYSILPENLQGGMKRYIEDGIKPGDFLTACLQNDLIMAVGFASSKTYDYLYGVTYFLYNEVPGRGSPHCPWGSREAVLRHIERIGAAKAKQEAQ